MAKETEVQTRKKDKWDILQIILTPIGGLFTGLAIALVGFLCSSMLQKNQSKEMNLRLYSELMSKREEAENRLRSDMFQQIFKSFSEPSTNDKQDKFEKLDHDLLNLQLLTRNFHETIDTKPLFKHLLFDIIKLKKNNSNKSGKDAGIKTNSRSTHDVIDNHLNELLNIANEIKNKQMEVLKEAGSFMEIVVPLKNVCTDIKPRQLQEGMKCNMPGVTKVQTLGIGENHTRDFTVEVKWAYPQWRQVRVKVTAINDKNQKSKMGNEEKEFWVGYFDFPMVDNTYLSDGERYSVALTDIDNEKKHEARLILVYYPAVYAGLQEKSFYHQKALNHLESSNFFDQINK